MNRNYYMAIVLSLLLSFSCWSTAETSFNRVISFGDSLSDPGNYFTLYGEKTLQPFEPDNIPSAPYAIGGHHFSNGKTWLEQLTHILKMPTDGKAAMLGPAQFTNYAVGRSRARNISDGSVFDRYGLTDQVDAFLAVMTCLMHFSPETRNRLWERQSRTPSPRLADCMGMALVNFSYLICLISRGHRRLSG